MHHMHDVFAQTTSIIGHEEEEVTIDPTKWGAWAHRGHRLWASMSEDFWIHVYKVQRCRCRQPRRTPCPTRQRAKADAARHAALRRRSFRTTRPEAASARQRAHAPLPPRHGVFELWCTRPAQTPIVRRTPCSRRSRFCPLRRRA